MCIKAAEHKPEALENLPDHFKTDDTCKDAVRREPYALGYIPDHLKAQEMCGKAIEEDPWRLNAVPDCFKNKRKCEKAVEDEPWLLEYVPDWSVTQQQAKLWDDYCTDGGYIKCYEGYQKRKTQKPRIKEGLLPTAWHPSRYWDWCVPEDEKKRQKNYGNKHRLFCI